MPSGGRRGNDLDTAGRTGTHRQGQQTGTPATRTTTGARTRTPVDTPATKAPPSRSRNQQTARVVLDNDAIASNTLPSSSSRTRIQRIMMTPQEIAFTNAFNANRQCLALFAKCSTLDELHVIRDAFYLGMASICCKKEYEVVREEVITDEASASTIIASMNGPKALESMITSARSSAGWGPLLGALHELSSAVGSDLDQIWEGLESGRLEWIGALSAAHKLKLILKAALNKDDRHSQDDDTDAKMVWMYALSLSIPALAHAREAWARTVQLQEPTNPLKHYNSELWDCRKAEWRPLDLGVQDAAERGGSSVNEAWDA